MGFLMEQDCRCCQKFIRTGDMWHDKWCWERWHNGLRDLDWEDEETFRAKHKNGGKINIEEIIKKYENKKLQLLFEHTVAKNASLG